VTVMFATFVKPVDESEVDVEFKGVLELDATVGAANPNVSGEFDVVVTVTAALNVAEGETVDEVE
jgi:hypothetical protein